jgi:hypothetical protein
MDQCRIGQESLFLHGGADTSPEFNGNSSNPPAVQR